MQAWWGFLTAFIHFVLFSFLANGIDGATLELLNDRMVRDLFPNNIAQQVKFEKAVELMKTAMTPTNEVAAGEGAIDEDQAADEESEPNVNVDR